MSRLSATPRRRGVGRWAGVGVSAALLLLQAAASQAQQVSNPYPPAGQFRTLQLAALACSRDNDTKSCDKARSLADPLLDHVRLSATCKDTLFAIVSKAYPAPVNSIERRDRIDRPAKDVTVFCRQPSRPASSSGSAPAAGSGAAGGSSPASGGSMFSAPR